MKWSNTITLGRPPKDICLLTGSPSIKWEDLARQREEAAYARGRRDGEIALNEQLVRQRAELAEVKRGVLTSLQNAVPDVVEATERVVIRLALEAAQKVVAGIPVSAELVETVVREALQQVKDTADVTVNLHPEDLALLRQIETPLLGGTPEIGSLKFVASPEVPRGGCLVQTRFGLIDARREVKLEQLSQSLGL